MNQSFKFATLRTLGSFIIARNFFKSAVARSAKCAKKGKKSKDPLMKLLAPMIKKERKKVMAFRKECGDTVISKVTVKQAYGGMRGVKGMVTETSVLDPNKGIKFRGLTIPDCQEQLPKAKGGCEPLPEGIFWLLLTGKVPTEDEVKFLSKQWAKRACLHEHVVRLLDTMPKNVHPMAQLGAAVNLCQVGSHFLKFYNSKKFDRKEAWRYTYEDAMDLIAKLPPICAKIYMNTYKKKKCEYDFIGAKGDWTKNFCEAIELTDKEFVELMRMYFTIHCDHEGGNVSAHTTHLVGSALTDPYLAYAAGMNGLAGPLHGLANQEVLRFLEKLREKLGDDPSEEDVAQFCKDVLGSGRVIPGYGHAVLRKTDPRYVCQAEFGKKHLPDDPLFKIVAKLFKVVPGILKGLGKVANPWPNVDAHSGVLLQYYGMCEMNFYTVLFAMSRALGVLAQLVWARGLMLPIERPKSISTKDLMKLVKG